MRAESSSVDAERGAGRTNRTHRRRRPGRLRQWWLDRSVRSKALWSMGLPLLMVVLILLGAVALTNRQDQLRWEVRETRGLIDDTDRLLLDLGLAQTAVWRYAVSGQERFLDPYENLAPGLAERAEALDGGVEALLGRDRPDVVAPVRSTLDALGRLRAAMADAAVADSDADAASRSLDVAFARLLYVRGTLHDHLERSLADLDRVFRMLSTTLVVGVAVALLLGLLGAAITTRDIVTRIEALTDNVDRFTAGERMTPIAAARDEIGRLTSTLEGVGRLLRTSRAQLTASRDEALAATHAKDELLSRMSHELRTPLTAIIGFGELLQMEDMRAADRESVDHIVTAGHHLLALVNEVLDIAKIETGHLSLSVGPVGVAGLVEETVALVGPQAAERDVTVATTCEQGVSVIADRHRLRQVLLNLLSNAVKYNRHGGRVDVACEAGDETVRIAVTDTGMGISSSGAERLFRPFDRLDALNTTIEGTGVGLALSKGLVEAMGGVIGVTSEVGRGSTFWVDLARAYAVAEPDGPAAEARPTREHEPDGGVPILYVEDNLANLRQMERLFRDRPERLEVAVQGRRSLELVRQLRPRLILLDLNLPDIDGTDVLRLLKASPATAGIPVVIISADATPRRIEQLLDQGAAAYLTKPIDVLRLLDVLDTFALPEAPNPAR